MQDIQTITESLATQLGYSDVPFSVSPNEAAQVLGATLGTLEVWRCTGRYQIPFVKAGRRVRYPLAGLAEFLASRTQTSTGGAQ